MENLFKEIIGEQLSSVVFVQDYLQLNFDGNTLTCYVWPLVKNDSQIYNILIGGYRDALCEIISHKVTSVSLVEEKKLEIYFDNKVTIYFNLVRNEATINLPEFIYFNSADDKWFVLD